MDPQFRYTVERDLWGLVHVEVALVRRPSTHGLLGRLHHQPHAEPVVLVDTQSLQGSVRITLYERWFDGHELRCDELARREFYASDDQALVTSGEFVAELEDWAERRNEERKLSYLEGSVEDDVRQQQALERASAADELAQILARHCQGS
jgi:hypothetical protein